NLFICPHIRLLKAIRSVTLLLSNLRDIDGTDLDVFEKLVLFELAGASVLAAGPQ
ncbi:hypothetical protein RMSM_07313, partial [Rhodopirellula maiorica SM1]